MSAVKMPEFPIEAEYDANMPPRFQGDVRGMFCYEHKRATAWEARARVAVEALREMAWVGTGPYPGDAKMDQLSYCHMECVQNAREALALIGPLPPTERAGGRVK